MAIVFKPAFAFPLTHACGPWRGDAEQHDIGWCEGVLSDGRPFRAEMWAEAEISMLTLFFAKAGLEELDAPRALALGRAEGLFTEKPGWIPSASLVGFEDLAGASLWALNVVVGDADDTRLAASVPIQGYRKDGLPNSLMHNAQS